MWIVYLIAGGGLTLWYGLSLALRAALRLTGMESLYFTIFWMVLGLIAAGAAIWYFWNRRKAERAGAAGGGEAGTDSEMDALVKEAEARLSGAVRGAKIGNVPVIFVVGETGSTKTSTVMHSGLEPELLAGQVYQNSNITATRAANLWFARQVVLAEAGGKLLAEPARWKRLIARLRPGNLASVMGKGGQAPRAVVVCFDCEAFTRPGAAEAVTAAARNLRARLGEISETFGINLPVYALFTKMDRLPFFTDYVRNLTIEEAHKILGATVPMRAASAAGVYGEEEAARLSARFEELFRSLCDYRPEFLSRENDPSKLPGVYEFPREFRKIRSMVVDFLVDLCRPSQLTVGPFLRGFYFSGVRPVVVTEAAPAPRQERPAAEGVSAATGMFRAGAMQPAAPMAPAGAPRKVPQWLFLPHFFNDIVLADRAAMGASGASTKTSFLQRLLFIGAAALGLILAIGFTISFFNNRSLSNQVIEAARGISAAEASGMDLPSADALKRLETLRQSVETLSVYNRQGAPWRYRWGLYVGDDLLPEVRRTYFAKFHQLLLGGTQGAMLASLQGLPPAPGPEYGPTYDTLKAYLITTSHHDKSTREFLTPALMERWAAGRTVDPERQELARLQFDFYAGELQLANMFSSANDGAAIEKARRYLAQFAGIEPIYRFMLAEAGKGNPPINFNKRFPGSAAVVTAKYEVPGAFGKGGWDFMQAALKNPEKYFAGEPWVLGQQTAAAVDRSKLEAQIREMYHKDFIEQWRNYFKAAGVVRYASVKDAAQKLNALSGNQTPLLALFWLASQNTNVDDPKVAAALQPVHAVVPPASVDRYIADSNQNYMNALMALQASIEQAAAAPGQPSDAVAEQTLGQAGAAKQATRQLAQAFLIDTGGLSSTVQNLLEQPITYVEGLLRLLGPAELNAKGKGLCAQFRSLMAKYPFNPASQTPASIQEVNALFRRPDGALWAFYTESLQKALPRQGTQYVAAPGAGINLNPAFVSFFNRAAAFAEAAYAEGSQDPRIGYTLRPVPTQGTVATSLRIDGQTLAFSGGAPQPAKFVWQGGGAHEAVATVKFGGSDLGWANYQGLWAAFQFFGDAERWIPAGSGFNVEWIVRVGKNPVTLEGRPLTVQYNLDMNGAPPVFQRGYFGGMGCVADVARP